MNHNLSDQQRLEYGVVVLLLVRETRQQLGVKYFVAVLFIFSLHRVTAVVGHERQTRVRPRPY